MHHLEALNLNPEGDEIKKYIGENKVTCLISPVAVKDMGRNITEAGQLRILLK